jgi:hypothetical protein
VWGLGDGGAAYETEQRMLLPGGVLGIDTLRPFACRAGHALMGTILTSLHRSEHR